MPYRPYRDQGPIRLSARERKRPAPARNDAAQAAPVQASVQAPVQPQLQAPRRPAAPAAAPLPPPSPGEAAAARARRTIERARTRELCEWFELHRLCARQRCRRAAGCRGEPVACLRMGLAQAPAALVEFARRLRAAQEDSLGVEAAFEELADYHEVLFAWTAGLAAAAPRQHGARRRPTPQSPGAPDAAAEPV
jgi:hypothetical protein